MNSKNENLKNEANSIFGSVHGRSKKKKIAIFHCGFIYNGGGERIVLEEAIGLKERGFDVEVYAPTLDSDKCYPQMVNKLGVKMFLPCFINELPFRNAIRMIVSSVLAPFFSYRFRSTDVFIGANQPGAWIAFCVAKILRKPYIVYLNQPNRIIYPRPVDLDYGWSTTVRDYQVLFRIFRLIKPIFAWLDNISIRSANAVLTNGNYIGGVIENVYSKTCLDVPAGSHSSPISELKIDQAYEGSILVSGKRIRKPYALITNRHDPQKRFDYVISALKIVLRTYQKAKLIIPGQFTDNTKELLRLTRKLGLRNKVVFLGPVSEQELQLLYQNAALYCYPSPEEDFGLGPIEAGGWGVPTVAWRHGGPTVTVEDGKTGLLAEPYEIPDFANKMLFLFKNKKKRSEMGKAAWKRTKEIFSWKNHIDALEETIKEIS